MKKLLILVPVLMVLLGGFFLYQSVFGPAPEASGPTVATPLASSPDAAGLRKFHINSGKSEARFLISEVLLGQPKVVVGATRQVAAEVGVDLSDLSKIQIGEVQINARTLKTDDDRRNGMLGNRILATAQYEFIKFAPTQIAGLTGVGSPGAKLPFTIQGDLTVRQITKPVTFAATLEILSPSELKVTANAAVKRADFQLQIPSVPSVANVGEDVRLEINAVVAAP